MDRTVMSNLQKRPEILSILIAIISAIVLFLNGYGLTLGITNVLPHLFYIPIILTAYFFPRRGIHFALAISALYCCMIFIVNPAIPGEFIAAIGRIAIFILIGAFVSYLTHRIQESGRQFRGVTERSSDIILLTSSAGKALYVSPSVKKILGFDPEEITGHMPQSFIHPDDIRVLEESIPQIIQGSLHVEITLRMKRKDDTWADIEFSGSPIIQNGQVTGIQVIGRDITARRQMENELRDTNRRLTDIVDFLPDPTRVIDAEGTITAWNRAMEKLTGIPAATILGNGDYAYAVWFYGKPRPVLLDLVLKQDFEAIRMMYPRYHQIGHVIFAEAGLQRPDGPRMEFWITATPLFNHNGEIVGAIESLRDVTHHKEIARAWKETKNYLDAIINTIPDPIFVKDREHRFVTLNNGFCRFTGHTQEELLHKTDYEFFPKEEADIFRIKDEDVFTTRVANENEETLTDAKGNRHTIATKKSLYVSSDGEEFLVGIIRDISERKQMETALREVNKKLNLLSSITRHDINNQLFSLKAFLELSRESINNPTQVSEFLGRVERAAGAIEHQIAFTSEYQHLGVSAPTWQDISASLTHACQALPLRDIRVIDEITGLEIYADRLFEKVFYNLIDNALRYGGPAMTTIRFSRIESGQSLVIVAEDDGAGISAEDKKRLFERGFGKHTGLGLFFIREILSITAITIAETGEPGRGARFEIVVPAGAWRATGTKK